RWWSPCWHSGRRDGRIASTASMDRREEQRHAEASFLRFRPYRLRRARCARHRRRGAILRPVQQRHAGLRHSVLAQLRAVDPRRRRDLRARPALTATAGAEVCLSPALSVSRSDHAAATLQLINGSESNANIETDLTGP